MEGPEIACGRKVPMNSELARTASARYKTTSGSHLDIKDPLPPHKSTSLSLTSSSFMHDWFFLTHVIWNRLLAEAPKQPRMNRSRVLAHCASEHVPCSTLLLTFFPCKAAGSSPPQVQSLAVRNRGALHDPALHPATPRGMKGRKVTARDRSSIGGMKTMPITAPAEDKNQWAKVLCVRKKITLIKNSFQSLVPYRAGNSWSLWAGWRTPLLWSLKFWHCWNCHKPVRVRWW